VLAGRYGLSSETIAFLRAGGSFLILLVALAVGRPSWLRIARPDLPFFALFGLVGIAGFYIVYAYAIRLSGMAVAVVLMYTAPAWVVLIARWAFGEPLNVRKIAALVLVFGGCVLVGGVYDLASVRLDIPGILFGLGSGVTYGLYTIFQKRALQDYSPWTALLYALAFGTLFLIPFQSQAALANVVREPLLLGWTFLLALGPTLGAALLYALGLQRLPASVASIAATWEPALATVLAATVLGENLSIPQVVGIALIVSGVVLLSRRATGSDHPS
jgi:drug/metabolite transporter (DMT)-like permease